MQLKKDLALIGALLLVVAGLVIFGGGITPLGLLKAPNATPSAQTTKTSTQVVINGLNVDADISANAKEREKGLSNRDSLPIAKGMLFVFEQPDNYTFWMKGMKFAIDIIWMDENKKVVYISKNAAPEPGKNDSQLTRYAPENSNVLVKYVLEVNAGLSDRNNVQVGDTADFQL